MLGPAGKPSAPGRKRTPRVAIPGAIPLQHKALQRFTLVCGLTPCVEHGSLPALARRVLMGHESLFLDDFGSVIGLSGGETERQSKTDSASDRMGRNSLRFPLSRQNMEVS